MIDLKQEIADFLSVAKLSGVLISEKDVEIEVLNAPHQPPKVLPNKKMAIYIFFHGTECLKIGKVGPKSQARYTSQHYNPNSSNSNLAKSILKDKSMSNIKGISEDNVGKWIKTKTDRINIIVSDKLGISTLTLFEVFLQCRLKPRYEGFDSQKV